MGSPERTRKIDIYRSLSLYVPCEGVSADRAAGTLQEITAEAIHIHDCLELVYILSGTARVKISFNSFILRQGEFLVINAGEVHRITDQRLTSGRGTGPTAPGGPLWPKEGNEESAPGGFPTPNECDAAASIGSPAPHTASNAAVPAQDAAPLIALQMYLDPGQQPEANLMIFHPDFYNREKPQLSQQVTAMMRRWYELSAAEAGGAHVLPGLAASVSPDAAYRSKYRTDAEEPITASEAQSRRLAREIAAFCRQNFAIQRYSPDEGQAREKADLSQSGERAASFFSYMYENYDQPLRLGDVADHLHLEQAYASRIIKGDTGAGFLEQLNIIRSDRSELWLLATDQKIQSIAETVGFPSYDVYARVFRQHFGMSPGAYRKTYHPQTHPAAPMQVRSIDPSKGWSPAPDARGLTLQEFDDRFVLTIYKG